MFALTGIGHLVTNDETVGQGKLGVLHDAALVSDDAGNVSWVGKQSELASHFAARALAIGGMAWILLGYLCGYFWRKENF